MAKSSRYVLGLCLDKERDEKLINMLNSKAPFENIDKDNVVGTWRVNIPYSAYTADTENGKK